MNVSYRGKYIKLEINCSFIILAELKGSCIIKNYSLGFIRLTYNHKKEKGKRRVLVV